MLLPGGRWRDQLLLCHEFKEVPCYCDKLDVMEVENIVKDPKKDKEEDMEQGTKRGEKHAPMNSLGSAEGPGIASS